MSRNQKKIIFVLHGRGSVMQILVFVESDIVVLLFWEPFVCEELSEPLITEGVVLHKRVFYNAYRLFACISCHILESLFKH